mgnify:FL=1
MNQDVYLGKSHSEALVSTTHTTSSPYHITWDSTEAGLRNYQLKNSNNNTGGVYPFARLPDARLCQLGHLYNFYNHAGAVTNFVMIQDNAGTNLFVIKGYDGVSSVENALVFLTDNSTQAGVWACMRHNQPNGTLADHLITATTS